MVVEWRGPPGARARGLPDLPVSGGVDVRETRAGEDGDVSEIGEGGDAGLEEMEVDVLEPVFGEGRGFGGPELVRREEDGGAAVGGEAEGGGLGEAVGVGLEAGDPAVEGGVVP